MWPAAVTRRLPPRYRGEGSADNHPPREARAYRVISPQQFSQSVLDALVECDCMTSMKLKFFAGLMAVAVLVAGCVNTVTGGRTAGVPFIKDTIEARYDKPAEPIFQAARQVINENGTMITEGNLYGQTNALGNMVRTIKGKVNDRTVYIRVEALDPRITGTSVQTRTTAGGSDIDLAAQIDKQIAIKLAH